MASIIKTSYHQARKLTKTILSVQSFYLKKQQEKIILRKRNYEK